MTTVRINRKTLFKDDVVALKRAFLSECLLRLRTAHFFLGAAFGLATFFAGAFLVAAVFLTTFLGLLVAFLGLLAAFIGLLAAFLTAAGFFAFFDDFLTTAGFFAVFSILCILRMLLRLKVRTDWDLDLHSLLIFHHSSSDSTEVT